MQDATTVLSIIRNRGERGLPLTKLYRQLYNPQFYFRAYVNLYSNDGAMTPDDTGETVDGMSKEKIKTMIDLLRQERWRWTPVKRVFIPKRNGKLRPLGLPIWVSYCLSFQGVFGILRVVCLVGRPFRSTLYHSTTRSPC